VFLEIINGINDKRFNSRPAHTPNHDEEEVAKNIPVIRKKKKKKKRREMMNYSFTP